jgi:hypothetical protein
MVFLCLRIIFVVLLIVVLFNVSQSPSYAQEDDNLRAKIQNPIGSLISVPIETTVDFGAPDGSALFISLQPVIPLQVGSVNLINRTILPIIYAPGPILGNPGNPSPSQGSSAFGLGDINHSVFLSPANPGKIIWGIGPAVSFPTATDSILGSGKWSAGPTAVVLTQPKPWSIGMLVANLWSFAGDSDRDDVNQLISQAFITYNLSGGWSLTSEPVFTANWKADSSQRWVVPVGGGVGKLINIANKPVNLKLQSFYNVERPDGAPDWTMKFLVQFIFPK